MKRPCTKVKSIAFIKSNRKILGGVAACKLVEGFFVLLTAAALVAFVDSAAEKFLAAAGGFFAGRTICAALTEKFFARLSTNVQTNFRRRIHEQIFGDKEISGGEILTLTFDALKSIDEFFLKVAPSVASAIIFLPVFWICAAFTDFLTAAILLATLPVAPILLWLIGRATAEKNSRAWLELQRLNGDFREILSAITTLKIFGRLEFGAKKIRAASEKSSAATLEVLKLAFVSSFALELITTLSIALVAVTLGLRLLSGGVEFRAALFLLLVAPEFFLPVRKFGVAFHVMISARSSLDKLKNFLQTSTQITGTVEKIFMPPKISLVDVNFTYPKKFSPTLQNLNLTFAAGKITALIGSSGAGKSTVLKILAGLLQPDSGSIKFADAQTDCAFRIAHCSLLPQAPHLFAAPLAENFSLFGALDDSPLKNFLSALNLSSLDFNARKLSRGQLQRLGIVRALLKNSPILLLDEPTAGLDAATEQKVLALIKKIATQKTIVIATHRLAVIKFSDEVAEIHTP